MARLIKRGFPCRVSHIDEYGNRWISVRLKVGRRYEHHTWAITETSGWHQVKSRTA